MKQKGLAPLVIIILIALAVGGFLIYQKQFKPAVPQSVTQSAPSPVVSDETANWKTYTNLGVKFQYSADFSLKEDTNNSTQYIADFKKGDRNFRMDKLTASSENEAPFNKTNITKTFNNITWKVVPPEQTGQYCDAGNCGKTAPNYYVYRNGYRYSFTYYSDDLQPIIEQILSTFKFLP